MGKIKKWKRSRQIILLVVLIFITFSYAMFQGGFVSWFLFYTLMPFFLYALILSFIPIKIQNIQREIIPTRFVRGKSGQVKVQFQIQSWFPFIYLTVQEIGARDIRKEKAMFFVGWKRHFEWSYELHHLKRGIYHFEGLQLEFHDFFGWMTRKKTIHCPQSLIVYPNVFPISYKPVQLQNEQGGNAFQFSLMKDTTLVTGVRNYQSGDQFSRIHWKSFAKDETLRTKEFEDRKSQKLFLLLDRTVEQHFDDVVDLTASIIQAVVKHYEEISFLSVGQDRFYEPNITTAIQVEKVLEHLALVKPDSQLSIDSILLKEAYLLKGSLVFIITGFLSEEVKSFFAKQGGRFNIICFVVGNLKEYETMKTSIREHPNVKIVPITKEMFYQAFTEVTKP